MRRGRVKRFALPPSSRCTRKIVKWRRRRKKAGASTTTSFRGSTSVGRSAPPSVPPSLRPSVHHRHHPAHSHRLRKRRALRQKKRRFHSPPVPSSSTARFVLSQQRWIQRRNPLRKKQGGNISKGGGIAAARTGGQPPVEDEGEREEQTTKEALPPPFPLELESRGEQKAGGGGLFPKKDGGGEGTVAAAPGVGRASLLAGTKVNWAPLPLSLFWASEEAKDFWVEVVVVAWWCPILSVVVCLLLLFPSFLIFHPSSAGAQDIFSAPSSPFAPRGKKIPLVAVIVAAVQAFLPVGFLTFCPLRRCVRSNPPRLDMEWQRRRKRERENWKPHSPLSSYAPSRGRFFRQINHSPPSRRPFE